MQLDMERLVEQYGTMVVRQAYFYLRDRHKAEDIAQEVFLRVYKKQPELPDEISEKAYLIRVTINACKDVLKSAWNRRVSSMPEEYDTPSGGETPEESYVAAEGKSKLFNTVLSLPEIYKDVVILFYYHDMSTAQIAKTLQVPEVTVRTRLMRARKKLAEMLKGE